MAAIATTINKKARALRTFNNGSYEALKRVKANSHCNISGTTIYVEQGVGNGTWGCLDCLAKNGYTVRMVEQKEAKTESKGFDLKTRVYNGKVFAARKF